MKLTAEGEIRHLKNLKNRKWHPDFGAGHFGNFAETGDEISIVSPLSGASGLEVGDTVDVVEGNRLAVNIKVCRASAGKICKMKPMTTLNRSTWIMASLIATVAGLGLASKLVGLATWLEAASFITGAICVWLTVKESVWNFPIGLVNAATFSVVFFESKLFADAGLQVVYFVMIMIGWYLWLRGGENHSALKVTRAAGRELTILAGVIVLSTAGLWRTLHLYGGSASFWDALTTSMSLGAQWLLNKKRVESWHLWIAVDIIYVPLYVYKELYLTAVLYLVFLIMAFLGLKQWRQVSVSS